jgi:hypothetical protein
MNTSPPTLEFKHHKRLVSPLEIDIENIQGQYADGKWHEPIYAAVKHWAAKKEFQGTATIWIREMPSCNFGDYSNTFCLVAIGMPGFMKQLETRLLGSFRKQVRRSDEILVKRATWQPYLHLEHGKVWITSEAGEWKKCE